jgi:ribose 5-phosphate isomerase B
MRVAVGSDHAGFALKQVLKAELTERGHEVDDLGTANGEASVDYPDYGAAVGRAVVSGRAELGVCTCGTGIGIAMAANKIPGVRAAVIHDATTATLAREHNHANVICLGGRVLSRAVALDALASFLSATEQRRHDVRIAKLADLDLGLDPALDLEGMPSS